MPGNGAASRLLKAAAHQDAELIMPPPENKVGAVAAHGRTTRAAEALDRSRGGRRNGLHPHRRARPPVPPAVRAILATAISPDDELVACSRGNRLFVYDLRGMQLAAEPVDPALANTAGAGAAHEDLIRSLAFDRQGTLLAAGGFRSVKLWRRPAAKLARELATAARRAQVHAAAMVYCWPWATKRAESIWAVSMARRPPRQSRPWGRGNRSCVYSGRQAALFGRSRQDGQGLGRGQRRCPGHLDAGRRNPGPDTARLGHAHCHGRRGQYDPHLVGRGSRHSARRRAPQPLRELKGTQARSWPWPCPPNRATG